MSPLHFSGDKAMAANASPPEWGTQETAAWRPPVGPPATIAGGIIVEHLLIDRAIRELYQPSPAGIVVPRRRAAEAVQQCPALLWTWRVPRRMVRCIELYGSG